MKKINSINLLGARNTGNSTPLYGLSLQDDGYLIGSFSQQDVAGGSSPATPIIMGGTRITTLQLANASGTGVLKPEVDVNTGFDPTFGGKLQIINGGTWTNYGRWTATFDPPSIAAGASATHEVECPGLRNASVPLAATFSNQNDGIVITATYKSATIVLVRFENKSGAAVDLGSGTITVRALL